MFKKLILTAFIFTTVFYSCKKDASPYPTPAVQKTDTVVTPFKLQENIYPNPNKGVFTISTNTTDSQNVVIYDRWGRNILDININGTTTIVDTSLQNGIYVISISSKLGTFKNRIVVSK